jgi:nuclear pore complex protein Nup155
LFIKGARILEFEHLREVCGDYQQLNYAKGDHFAQKSHAVLIFYIGAIELPLKCAQVVDSDGIGFEYWSAGSPANDPRSEICERRLQCYDLVLDSLTVFEEKSANVKTTGAADPTAVDLEAVRSHAYELAFSSEDEMFHSTMYDWLIDRGVADELLEVRRIHYWPTLLLIDTYFKMRPAFLEAHLRREPATAAKLQLLWQFYVKDGQPLRAAEVLGTLAESVQSVSQIDLNLSCRFNSTNIP